MLRLSLDDVEDFLSCLHACCVQANLWDEWGESHSGIDHNHYNHNYCFLINLLATDWTRLLIA